MLWKSDARELTQRVYADVNSGQMLLACKAFEGSAVLVSVSAVRAFSYGECKVQHTGPSNWLDSQNGKDVWFATGRQLLPPEECQIVVLLPRIITHTHISKRRPA